MVTKKKKKQQTEQNTKPSNFLKIFVLMMKEKHMFFEMEGIIVVNWKHSIPPVHQGATDEHNVCVCVYVYKEWAIDIKSQLAWNSKRSPLFNTLFFYLLRFRASTKSYKGDFTCAIQMWKYTQSCVSEKNDNRCGRLHLMFSKAKETGEVVLKLCVAILRQPRIKIFTFTQMTLKKLSQMYQIVVQLQRNSRSFVFIKLCIATVVQHFLWELCDVVSRLLLIIVLQLLW